ncbi:IS1096 element passenger TnpR family protein [Adlercreutzia mucosicola]|uniref:IS1096 element passenger TnpR family protein n=1 Tax=Adlercreutzia mucosicola TaxID=580026 RepID=UPI002B24B419|nr:hypothetical protein [Adlercreutzia mucosicola]MEB1814576.1 plasmid pRiA4b ORF-3 family protein [Adlercreutzia mucosicola]
MAAKIIPFPADARPAAQGAPRITDGGAAWSLIVELVHREHTPARSATVQPDASLADLHRILARLFSWDASHNYFFSYGSCRFEDPELFAGHDRLSAQCRKIYSAADVPVSAVLTHKTDALFYVYDLVNTWELRISRDHAVPLEQFG